MRLCPKFRYKLTLSDREAYDNIILEEEEFMYTLKCKMCGGDLQVIDGENIAECEYCGSKQTVPTVDDDKKRKLYDRANRLRFNCEFDKASVAFESIVNEFPYDAESYWGLVLCKYGIEYVDDPLTGKKIPTCHRSSFDSVMEDADFEMVMENAEPDARRLYREEAKQIEEIRKGILEVSGKEEPYDIFICYKETDKNGDRTLDSVLAQDVYGALTDKGYRLFFSRISLEDKLGTEYEPYIFAALNSAKVMLAFGTDYEYYNAVWVKNEWSRFLKLMSSDKEKYLIPCYKDIDAYDIPKEFARFQAQDLGKIGAIQDLIRGIDKIFGRDKSSKTTSGGSNGYTDASNMDIGMSTLNSQNISLLKRGHMALEDAEYDRASNFFELVLNNDAECAQAYWGKVLSTKAVKNTNELAEHIVEIICETKKTETISFNRPKLVEVAREIDSGFNLLVDFSDEELSVLLEDQKKPETYESSIAYYNNLIKTMDESFLVGFLDDRNFDRALRYRDEAVRNNIEELIHNLKEKLSKIVLEEQKLESDNVKNANNENRGIAIEIRNRIQKAAADKEKAIEDKKKREEKIISQHESEKDVNDEIEREYADSLRRYEEEKKKYEADLFIANSRRAEYQREIFRMKQERDRLSGLQSIKKKKEIDNYIETLENQKNLVKMPDFPGAKPQRRSLSKLELEQQEEENDFTEIDPQSIVRCILSPSYKENYDICKQASYMIWQGTKQEKEFQIEEADRYYNDAKNLLQTLTIDIEGADNIKRHCQEKIKNLKENVAFIVVKDGMTTCPRCGKVQKGNRSLCLKCEIKFVIKKDKANNETSNIKQEEVSDVCHKCGNRIDQDMKYCPKCGAILK